MVSNLEVKMPLSINTRMQSAIAAMEIEEKKDKLEAAQAASAVAGANPGSVAKRRRT